MSTVLAVFVRTLVERFGVDEGGVSGESSLTSLGLDSLAVVEFSDLIQRELDVLLAEEDVDPDGALGDVAALVEEKRSAV